MHWLNPWTKAISTNSLKGQLECFDDAKLNAVTSVKTEDWRISTVGTNSRFCMICRGKTREAPTTCKQTEWQKTYRQTDRHSLLTDTKKQCHTHVEVSGDIVFGCRIWPCEIFGIWQYIYHYWTQEFVTTQTDHVLRTSYCRPTNKQQKATLFAVLPFSQQHIICIQ